MRCTLAIIALTTLVAVNANVAAVGSSHLKLSSSSKAIGKVAEFADKNAVVITAAKKTAVAPLPPKPAYQDTLKMVGLFALW